MTGLDFFLVTACCFVIIVSIFGWWLGRDELLQEPEPLEASVNRHLNTRLALAIERRHEQSRLAYQIDPGMALVNQTHRQGEEQ